MTILGKLAVNESFEVESESDGSATVLETGLFLVNKNNSSFLSFFLFLSFTYQCLAWCLAGGAHSVNLC